MIAGFELMWVQKKIAWFVLAALVVLVVFSIWNFTKNTVNKRFANFLITPVVFTIAAFSFLLFIETPWLYHGVVVASALMMFLFLEQIFNYFYFAVRYQPYTLESFSLYWNVAAVFMISASLFGVVIFLMFNLAVVAAFYAVAIFVLTKQFFWVNKIEWARYALFCFAISLIMTEFFCAMRYLPTSYFVNGVIATIIFYVLICLSKLFLQDNLARKHIYNYLILSVVTVALVLATAQWF